MPHPGSRCYKAKRALEPAEKQAAKEYLAPNCVPKDTVPFEVPHCLRRR